VITGIFGDTWETINLPVDNILHSTENLRKLSGNVGYSTNGYKVIDYLITKNIILDKVMFFTDCQLWDSSFVDNSLEKSWLQYQKIAPNAKLYIFDLAGYGQSPLKLVNSNVFLISGWSDKIFDVLSAVDRGESAVETIMKVEL